MIGARPSLANGAVILPAGRRERGQVLVLLLILLAILGGGIWWLFHSRHQTEQGARAFALEAAQRLALYHDAKFLDARLGSEAQVRFPPSFRERLLDRLRQLGVPAPEIEIEGTVTFTSHFFEPRGQLRARLNYSPKPAYLDLAVSRKNSWQIDHLNLTWDPTPLVPPQSEVPPPLTPAPLTPAPLVAP